MAAPASLRRGGDGGRVLPHQVPWLEESERLKGDLLQERHSPQVLV